jgi:cell division protein FtsB
MNGRVKWGGMVIGITILYLVVSGNRGLWNLYKLHQEKTSLSRQVARLKLEISRSENEYHAMEKDPAILEKQAREDLNLVKPGEIIYKFGKAGQD